MATLPPEDPQERRLNLRRSRSAGGSGFSGGISTRSESYRENGEPDDEPPEDFDLRSGAVTRVNNNEPAIGDEHFSGTPSAAGEEVQQRVMNVAMAGSRSYAREYRLNVMDKMLRRGISLDVIANQLGVSISTAEKDRIEVKKMWRERARSLDINEHIGDNLNFYEEIKAMSLRVASKGRGADGSPGTPTAMQLAAMRTALAANADQTRFLASAGVYDVIAFRRAEDGNNLSDVQSLMQATDEMLRNAMAADETPEPPKPKAPPVMRRAKRAGFKPMEFTDNGGSSGDNEIEQL